MASSACKADPAHNETIPEQFRKARHLVFQTSVILSQSLNEWRVIARESILAQPQVLDSLHSPLLGHQAIDGAEEKRIRLSLIIIDTIYLSLGC